MTEKTITLQLSDAQALVLFEWLARSEEQRSLTFVHPAEQTVLSNLEGQLERLLTEPLAPDYEDLVRVARERVENGTG